MMHRTVIKMLIAFVLGLAVLTPAHAVSVVSWDLTDYDGDGLRSDFGFQTVHPVPPGNSVHQFGYTPEAGCVNAPDGSTCVPMLTNGSTQAFNLFTTGFFFGSDYFKPNLINGGIVADITGSTLTFSSLDWSGSWSGQQFFIPPSDITFDIDPTTGQIVITGGSVNPGLAVVEQFDDLGGGQYGVVVRWEGHILTTDGRLIPPFGPMVGMWRVEGIMSTVPVPAAVWLFGSGLIGVIGVARRKKKQA